MIKLPYGTKEIELNLNECAVLTSDIDSLKSDGNGLDIVKKAMQNPINSPKLSELAKGKKTATIIISDHTRPVPSKDIIPNMLEELREGNPDIEVSLLVATGCHRGTTKEELIDKLGEDIVANEKIVIHDCTDADSVVEIGVLPSGAPLVINKVAAEAELLVSEGFIEPHFFAGFSGGRKSILPGVAARTTVLGNHCSKFIHSEKARTGNLDGNPIHIDMLDAARQAKLAFIANVIIDEDKNTVAAFAGNYKDAHLAGCEFLKNYCRVKAVPADIAITTNGGAPLDQNVYQCVKGLTAAEGTAKEGAVLVMCAAIADGHGGEDFYESIKNCESAQALYDEFLAIPQDKTIPDQWEAQILARMLSKHQIIVVTEPGNKQLIEDMKMTYAASIEEALEMCRKIKGEDASITVVPNGVSVVVEK